METKGPSPYLYVPATCPYPEPDQSGQLPKPVYWIYILIPTSHISLGLASGLCPASFLIKTPYALLLFHIRATCLAHPTLAVWSHEYYLGDLSARNCAGYDRPGQACLSTNERKAERSRVDIVELRLSGLTGKARYPDVHKIRVSGFFFENRLHWRYEVLLLLFTLCTCV